jgi:hypothetical protein
MPSISSFAIAIFCLASLLNVHRAHPWSRRHYRRAAQSFPLHQRLRCCGHSLCSTGSGDVRRVVRHGVPSDLPHCGPPSGPHWSTPLFVPERPVLWTFCCQSEEHRSAQYRPVRSTPPTCPLLPPCPSYCAYLCALSLQRPTQSVLSLE